MKTSQAFKEFEVNLEKQKIEINHGDRVGYQYDDNTFVAGIFIKFPKELLKQKLKGEQK